MGRPHDPWGSERSFRRVWLLGFGVLVALSTIWSLATPLGAAPDENEHIVRAASVVRGELAGTPVAGSSSVFTKVQAPQTYAAAVDAPLCFVFKSTTPAGCERSFPSSFRSVSVQLYVGRYPPVYYAVVGLPTLLAAAPVGFYLARLVSALLADAFLAFAFAAAVSLAGSRLLLAGLLVAATPEVVYLTSVVNPSALEVASAIGLWTGLTVLFVHRRSDPPRLLVGWIGAAAVTLSLSRPVSPLWTFLALAAFCPIWLSRGRLAALVQRRDVQVVAAAGLLAAVAGTVWTVVEHATLVLNTTLPPRTASTFAILQGSIGQATDYLHQAVGVFGLDARSPELVVVLWVVAAGGVLLLGLARADAPGRRVLGLIVAAVLVVPTLSVFVAARKHGYIGFGRYFVPLYAGLPLLGGGLAEGVVVEENRRFATAVAVMVAVGQVVAFYWCLHRYLVGAGGPVLPTATVAGSWHPPLPGVVLDGLYLVVVAAAAAGTVRLLRAPVSGPPAGVAGRQEVASGVA